MTLVRSNSSFVDAGAHLPYVPSLITPTPQCGSGLGPDRFTLGAVPIENHGTTADGKMIKELLQFE